VYLICFRVAFRFHFVPCQHLCKKKELLKHQFSYSNDLLSDYFQLISSSNVWVADTGVIEALHLSPCDNLYSVIKGKQKFTLIPGWRYAELIPKTYSEEAFLLSQVFAQQCQLIVPLSHV
jgi:hypothetical protein